MNRLDFKRLPTGTISKLVAPLVVAMLALVDTSLATPITLAFEATITNVVTFSQFQLPFPAAVGDKFQGRFSFEPWPTGNYGQQQFPLRLDIGGISLESSPYNIGQAFNESPPYQNSVGVPVLDSETRIDQIYIDCLLSGCSPGTVPGSPALTWSTFIAMDGPSPFLSSHLQLESDLSVWNYFPVRGMEVNLYYKSRYTDGSARVEATFGPMVAVPEPSSYFLFVSMLIGIAIFAVPKFLPVR